MCGIVGATCERNVVPILIEGLRRLEYRGYDSAGIAVVTGGRIERLRVVGRVADLEERFRECPLRGELGIAHTRWATHGGPSERNAHPHLSCGTVAVVHNGIIENHDRLRRRLRERGYRFTSETDTEVIAHLIHLHLKESGTLREAVQKAVSELEGAYAIAAICTEEPQTLVGCRKGSPLVVGIGIGEHFLASDLLALLPVTRKFIFLEDGDLVELTPERLAIWNGEGSRVERPVQTSDLEPDIVALGPFRHFMQKEIFEQPQAVAQTLQGRVHQNRLLEESFGHGAKPLFDRTEHVQIVACGTSYHAGLVARYWLEGIAGIHCDVEIASEFRYRKPKLLPGTLLVAISQSGETADTLAAVKEAKRLGVLATLAIVNVPESSLTRLADLLFLTRAGPEIGVASTKAFTTQLAALYLLTVALGRRRGLREEARLIEKLLTVPRRLEEALRLERTIADRLAPKLADKEHALYLGRGVHYPVAMEGALKLKEIAYVHAEAYAAGELKHGPLALVDEAMPVVAVAPNDRLLEKLKANLEEVKARGGRLYVFADERAGLVGDGQVELYRVAPVEEVIAPFVLTVPLQLLAYHTAVIRGTDVDKPRNLAKSVTVE